MVDVFGGNPHGIIEACISVSIARLVPSASREGANPTVLHGTAITLLHFVHWIVRTVCSRLKSTVCPAFIYLGKKLGMLVVTYAGLARVDSAK